jgi:hypothetical protein
MPRKPHDHADEASAAGLPATQTSGSPEPYRPFPSATLPAPLDVYVERGASALGCDPACLALPVLAVAAAAVGNTRTLRLRRHREEPSVVWTALVGPVAAANAAACRAAVRPLFRLEQRSLAEFRRQSREHAQAQAHYQAALRNDLKDEGTLSGRVRRMMEASWTTRGQPGTVDLDAPPQEPIPHRLVCGVSSLDRLVETLADNPRGLLVLRDELSGWLAGLCRGAGQHGDAELAAWLQLQRGGTVVVEARGRRRPALLIEPAGVSVTGSIRARALANLSDNLRGAGLGALLLLAMPPKPSGRGREEEMAPEVERSYETLLDRLLALDFDHVQGRCLPHALELAPAAREAWIAFADGLAREQAGAEEEPDDDAGVEAIAARLALLHHVVGRAARAENERGPVEKESVHAGLALCGWFAAEGRRIRAVLAAVPGEQDVRRLFDFVRARGGEITPRDLQRANGRKYATTEQAEAALEELVQAGWADWGPAPPGHRGRPGRILRLRPAPVPAASGAPLSDNNSEATS